MRKNGKIYNYGFNTQPPEGGCIILTYLYRLTVKFQHTATRRWLLKFGDFLRDVVKVSTHSHPKVAANKQYSHQLLYSRFNTQPPEGGCVF